MEEKKGIIFDLDGTLWDSSEEVVIAWNRVLERHPELHRRITAEDMQGYMGKSMDDIMLLMLPDQPLEVRKKILTELCEEEDRYLLEHGAKLYPGLWQVLTELKKDYHLYIVSNCQDGYVQCFLKVNRFEQLFDDIEMWGRTFLEKGDNISLIVKRNHLTKAVYVGDTLGDYNATKKAGLPFIHASYGFGKVPEPDAVLTEFAELPKVVSKFFCD